MKRIIIAICLVVLLLLGSLFAFIAFRRPPGRPTVLVRFAGFTNDTSGIRLATFAISNASPWAVVRGGHYRVQTQAGARWTNLTHGWFPGSTLRARASEVVTLTAPTNQSEWRVAFTSHQDEGAIFTMAGELLIEGQKLGFPTRYRRVGHPVYSDLIHEQP